MCAWDFLITLRLKSRDIKIERGNLNTTSKNIYNNTFSVVI